MRTRSNTGTLTEQSTKVTAHVTCPTDTVPGTWNETVLAEGRPFGSVDRRGWRRSELHGPKPAEQAHKRQCKRCRLGRAAQNARSVTRSTMTSPRHSAALLQRSMGPPEVLLFRARRRTVPHRALAARRPSSATVKSMDDRWSVAGKFRTEFADMVSALGDEQWNGPTLCVDWTPHDVLAHLTWFAETKSFLATMEATGFNIVEAIRDGVTEMTRRSPDDLIDVLRECATTTLPIPGAPEQGTVCDIAIHTQDVRRALGLAGQLDPTMLRGPLEFMVTHDYAAIVFDRTKVQGLRLVATDIEWTHGEGPEVIGAAEPIMMALAGRPTVDELHGDGVETLATRLQP